MLLVVLEIISNNMNYFCAQKFNKEATFITRDWFTHLCWLIKEQKAGKAYSQELKIMAGTI